MWVEWQTANASVTAVPAAGAWLPPRLYTLDEVPVYVRGGAVVPMKTLADAVVPPVAPARLVLVAFPGGGAGGDGGTATVYEDAGEGTAYATAGAYRLLNATQDARGAGGGLPLALTVTPHVGGAGYPGEPSVRAFSVHFLLAAPAVPSGVTANGAAVPHAAAPGAPPPSWWLASVGAYPAVIVELASGPAGASVRVVVT